MSELRRRLRQVGPGWICLTAGVLFVTVVWWPVIVGDRVLLGGDILHQFIPWRDGAPPAARNETMGDPMSQFLPSLTLLRQDLASHQLPLWNPYTLNGTPLLSNGTSAVLSPFTWLALPFQPDHGYSVAMLARFVIAGTGMAFLVRQLGGRPVSAAFAGIAYASSAFMVVWLGHPQSAVAALMPWAFGSVELYLATGRRRAFVAISLLVALQFFAGNEETSFQMGAFLILWVTVRASVQRGRRVRRLLTVGSAGLLGTALAAVQLVPFVASLQASSLAADRRQHGAGLGFLARSAAASWLIPNAHGNPGIDQAAGRAPNYPESTAFIGVGALMLVIPGAVLLWRTSRSAAVLLLAGLAFSTLTIYGVITPFVGRLPGFDASNNARLIALACFCGAALAGAGLESLLRCRRRLPSRAAVVPLSLAAAALGGLAVCSLTLKRDGGGVDALFATFHGQVGFWVVVLVLSGCTAAFLIAAALTGSAAPWVGAGFVSLAFAEALLFAAPFQPRTMPSDNPPSSPAMSWLAQHAGNDKIAGPGLTAFPNLSVRYGVYDTRGVDVLLSPRLRIFWQRADPGYDDSTLYTLLSRPRVDWLAAAGVRWYVSDAAGTLAGTVVRYRSGQTVVSEIPGSRPFAFGLTQGSTREAANAIAAAAAMAPDPLGPAVVEGCCAGRSSPATQPRLEPATVTRRNQSSVTLHVALPRDGVVILLQSYATGWEGVVDDRPVAIHPVDVLFQAVSVPAGSHEVTLRYRPASAEFGLLTSAAACLLVALVALPRGLRWSPRRALQGFRRGRGQRGQPSAGSPGAPPAPVSGR